MLVNGLDITDEFIDQGVRDAWQQSAVLYPGERCSREFLEVGGVLTVRTTRISDRDVTDIAVEP